MSDQIKDKKTARSAKSAGSSSGRRRESQGGPRRANRNGIAIIVLTIIVIGAVIGGIAASFGRRSSGSAGTSADPTISVEGSSSLEQNKYPEINELISNYRKAILEEDAALLKKVYNADVEVSSRILEGTSAIIESYNNTQYYTKPGLHEGEYVAFVYDELKIRGVDTLAPNLAVFYIKTAEDGSKYIYRGQYNPQSGSFVLDSDIESYMQSLYEEADVADLISTVNNKLESACAKDSALLDFIDQIRGRTGAVMETQAQTEAVSETQAVSETETESETEAAE